MSNTERPQHCNRPMQRNGKRKGRQQWRCPVCHYSLRDGEGIIGRPRLGDEPLTGAERWRRWKERKTNSGGI